MPREVCHPIEEHRCTRRELLRWGVLASAGGAAAGCDEVVVLPPRRSGAAIIGSFHIIGDGMYEAFKNWRESLREKDRDVLEKFLWQKDLLIHVFRATGRLSPLESRGGASAPASSKRIKKVCDFHPIYGDVPWKLSWDVAYDPELTKWFEEKYGIPTPPEVVLHHEIFGHVIPCLRDPKLIREVEMNSGLEMEDECGALPVENQYRKQIGLREVPPSLIGCRSP